MVLLGQYDLLCHGLSCSTMQNPSTLAVWVGFLVFVNYIHSTSGGHVESSQPSLLVYDCNEASIVNKDIYVVQRRHSDSNLELNMYGGICEGTSDLRA